MIKRYYIDSNIDIDIPANISCIGYFDGVHKGHQALISKTIEIALNKNVEPYIITFDPDPNSVISPSPSFSINTLNERIKLFEKFGIKGVIIIKFDLKLMNMSSYDFSNSYLKKLNLKGLVCGYDFHYGNKGKGNIQKLKKELKDICKVYTVDEVTYYSKKVSSTRIKNEIAKGNYRLVNKLLGYEYKR